MSKRYYYPNTELKDYSLPFTLEITSDPHTVYAKDKRGQATRADSIFLEHLDQIEVNHEGFIIRIKGFDKESHKPLYAIKKEVVE